MSGIRLRKPEEIKTTNFLYFPLFYLLLSQKKVTYSWGSLIIESLLPRAIILLICIISKVFGNSEAK